MAGKQTRRSISVSAEAYWRIDEYCKKHGMSRSGFVEARVREFFNKQVPDPPAPFAIGTRVNYHAVVGGPVTLPDTVITGGPYKRSDHTSWRIEGKPGTIDEAALSRVS